SDEIGEMARAVVVFKDNAFTAQRLATEREEERQRAEADKKAALVAMADKVEGDVRSSMAAVAQKTAAMYENADLMLSSAKAVSADAASVTAAACQTMETAQAVAGASQQLS